MVDANPADSPSLRMGEMRVDAEGRTLRTLLGSCIGLALYDRQRRIGGLAHILLPDSRGKQDLPGKFADTAIPSLIEQMQQLTTNRLGLTAVIAGGANMFNIGSTALIGDQNRDACRSILTRLNIPLVAEHCGGIKGRRMSFQTKTGKIVIEIVGMDPIELSSDPPTVPQR